MTGRSGGATAERPSPSSTPDPAAGAPGQGAARAPRWRRWLPAAAVAAVCLAPVWGLWLAQGAPMEEGFMLVFPEMVLDGKVPNRDFLHLYGPGSLWVLAAVFAVFGARLATERAVGLVQHLGVAFGVFALLRPWGPWVAAGGGAIAGAAIITTNGLAAMAWVGGVALALWALRSALEALDAEEGSRRRRRQLVVAGLLGGAALLYRLDLVLAIALPAVVLLPALDRASRRRLVAAFGAGLTPYLVHLAMAGPGNVFEGMVIEPIFELRGGRRLPLPPSSDHYDGFLQGAGALNEPPWPLPAPDGPLQLSLWLLLLFALYAVLVVAGVRCLRRRGDRRLLAIALLCVGLLPQALQRADSTHLAWVSCVPLGVLPAAVVELLRDRSRGPWRGPAARAAIAVATPIVLMLVLVPHFTWRSYADGVAQTLGYRRVEETIRHGDRTFPYKRLDAVAAVNDMLPVVDRVTEPGDRLFVGSGDLRKTPYSEAFLYYLLPDLEPATRYIEMDPGVANAPDSGLADEVASSDVVILSTIRDDWVEPNDSRLFGPDEPNQVLARDFCLVEEFGPGPFDPDRGLYELYVRC